MTLLHNFRAAFMVVALLGGCASDSQIQKPSTGEDEGDDDDSEDDDDGTSTKKDAGKDAGKAKDAGKDSGSGDDDDDDDELDAGKDAGKSDAGKDAGRSDGGTTDAGRTDAGRTDAGSSASCTNLTYAAFGKNFIDSYCALCHSQAQPQNDNVALNSLVNITARKEAVKAAVLSGSMPPSGIFDSPSDTERERFGAFIDCGPR